MAGRRQQGMLFPIAMAGVWMIGLGFTTGIVYTGFIVYQDHERLAELSRQPPPHSIAIALPPEALAAAQSYQPELAKTADLYRPGTWERAAQKYIHDQLATTISSANPPSHRRQ